MSLQDSERRTERYGQAWEWQDDLDSETRGHWRSTEGTLVMVFPPNDQVDYWIVQLDPEDMHEFSGKDAGERAFCVADLFTRQANFSG